MKTPWTRIATWVVATRALLFLMAGLSLSVLPSGLAMGTPKTVLHMFFHPQQPSNIAFFPLYPA